VQQAGQEQRVEGERRAAQGAWERRGPACGHQQQVAENERQNEGDEPSDWQRGAEHSPGHGDRRHLAGHGAPTEPDQPVQADLGPVVSLSL
jgi:hypothetical protein